MSKGKLIVISAPSGCGKSTVVHALMDARPNLKFSISATTRAPRIGEVDGKDYFFVSREKFMEMVAADEFLEHAIYVDNCYGTPRKALDEMLEKGMDVILDIDVQGAFQIREKRPDALMVFLMPPSFDDLEKRLIMRGKDSMEVIRNRLITAREECKVADKFDYIIVNDDLDRAVSEFSTIIDKEK
ncbi:MAG: guanylate kinase [Oscillospiraceae bacterium]|nr:guanylate kinase [Oscillospiraceae bacterium]